MILNKKNESNNNSLNKYNISYNTQRNNSNNYPRKNIMNKKINSFRESNIQYNNLINDNIKKLINQNNNIDNSDLINGNINNNNDDIKNIINEVNMNDYNEDFDDEENKINEILNLLEIDNINDIESKIQELIDIENFTNKIISLYEQFNQTSNKNKTNLKDILNWISFSAKNNNENIEYENYCKELMTINNINSFDKLKIFIDNVLNKNKKNNNFIGGVKKLLSSNIDDNIDENIITEHIKF